jgi:hypothetical protein
MIAIIVTDLQAQRTAYFQNGTAKIGRKRKTNGTPRAS